VYCITQEDIRILATNFVECHYNSGFQDITYVQTFQKLKDQFDHRPTSLLNTEERHGEDGDPYVAFTCN